MNWNNPLERAELVERVGIEAYNKAFEEYIRKSTIVTVGGHAIRPVQTRFGLLFQCGDTGRAFKSLKEAEDYALVNQSNKK